MVQRPAAPAPEAANDMPTRAAQEPAPEIAGETPAAPSQVAAIASFAAIAEHAKAVRDVRLYHHLMEDIRLVAFRPGHLEIRPEDNAPADLGNSLRRKLEAWTGQPWAVVINGQAEGQAPMAAQQRQAEAEILSDTEGDPLVQAVLDTFPGAKVTNVRPLGDGGLEGDADALQNDAPNGVEQR